eukprot:superscaffoldBa00000209_g2734
MFLWLGVLSLEPAGPKPTPVQNPYLGTRLALGGPCSIHQNSSCHGRQQHHSLGCLATLPVRSRATSPFPSTSEPPLSSVPKTKPLVPSFQLTHQPKQPLVPAELKQLLVPVGMQQLPVPAGVQRQSPVPELQLSCPCLPGVMESLVLGFLVSCFLWLLGLLALPPESAASPVASPPEGPHLRRWPPGQPPQGPCL